MYYKHFIDTRIHVRNTTQAIVVLNRALQEIGRSPGWGRGLGTEPADPPPNPDPDIFQECSIAAGEAISIYGLLPSNEYHHNLNMYGAQLFRHARQPPGMQWPGNSDTHLVASYGVMLSPEQLAACEVRQRRGLPHTYVCNGYLGVYVNFNWLGRALAARELGCTPTQVPTGPVMRRWREYAKDSIAWNSLMHRYSS